MFTQLGPNYENVQKWSESFLEIENGSLDAEGNISEIQSTSLFPPALPPQNFQKTLESEAPCKTKGDSHEQVSLL